MTDVKLRYLICSFNTEADPQAVYAFYANRVSDGLLLVSDAIQGALADDVAALLAECESLMSWNFVV